MVLFYFSPFLISEKYSVQKGFSKFPKKRFRFRGFYFRDFQTMNFFVKVPKIAKWRKFLHAKIYFSGISYIAHWLINCSIVNIFYCNVFLSKLNSIVLTDETSFTIMSLLLSLEWKRITYDAIEQSVFLRGRNKHLDVGFHHFLSRN